MAKDIFNREISAGTRSDADIASHYPYSQERWRLFETSTSESNRLFLEYAEDARYKHGNFGSGVSNGGDADVHQISPNAGDTLIFRTAERFRYVVGYESDVTMGISISQALQAGDSVEIGPFDENNGYGIEFNSTLGTDQCKIFIKRDGSKVEQRTVELFAPLTDFTRFSVRYAWYNVMGTVMEQTYDFSINRLGSIKRDGANRGPERGNLPITMKVTAGSATSNLTVNMGSVAWNTIGQVDNIVRSKSWKVTGLTLAANTDWQPVYCVRQDPNRNYIKSDIKEIEATEFSGDDDVFVLAMAFSPANLRAADGNVLEDSDFIVPPEISETNSILQATTDINQFPDNTGTLQTSTTNPGGYQLGYASLYTSSPSTGKQLRSIQRVVKRQLFDNDYLVILARTRAGTTGDLTIEITTEQDW